MARGPAPLAPRSIDRALCLCEASPPPHRARIRAAGRAAPRPGGATGVRRAPVRPARAAPGAAGPAAGRDEQPEAGDAHAADALGAALGHAADAGDGARAGRAL